MVARSPRSRSTASATTSMSNGHRPISRQSTTSIQSNTTQPAPVHPGASYQTGVGMPSAIWEQHQQAHNQMQGHCPPHSTNRFMVDSSLHSHGHGSFSQDAAAAFQPGTGMHMAAPALMTPIESKENMSFDMGVDTSGMGEATTEGAKRKKGSASSQANDNELRRLFRENEGRDLHDVALQVIRDEKGPKAEKTKQIFGMLWLHKHTKRSSGSVPRNRVFSSYATRCGTERVPPLNPASFGKLVRIIFPGITTRRLGVRGESKYHYVELSLVDDNRSERASVPRGRSMTIDVLRDSVGPNRETSTTQLPADTASFSPATSSPKTHHPEDLGIVTSHLYPQTTSWNENNHNVANMIHRPLRFTTATTSTSHQGDTQLELPSIEPYLSPGTDVDAVDSLTSVYRSHCLLAIDNFRFCKTDKLCDSYKSLVGLLTVPGQKLLCHPGISAWIRACDWMKYQKMIPMLDQILLTQVPKKAMAHMEHVSQNVCNWISQFFQNQPRYTQEAMLGPTHIFASLLERFLRVNRAALDVSQVLENTEERIQIWRDWLSHVKPLHVLQNSLLDHGHRRVLHILTQEVRFILGPIENSAAFVHDPVFLENGTQPSEFQREEFKLEAAGSSTSTIARLSRFLVALASRFPGVDARSLLNYIDVIGNNISRNLTLNGAASLGNWWRVKLFVDEMSYWLAEKGGFLSSTPQTLDDALQRSARATLAASKAREVLDQSRPQTSASGRGESLQPGPSYGQSITQPPPHTHSLGADGSAKESTEVIHEVTTKEEIGRSKSGSTVAEDDETGGFGDDSGIGMGLDEAFSVADKYPNFMDTINGSDNSDVVVC